MTLSQRTLYRSKQTGRLIRKPRRYSARLHRTERYEVQVSPQGRIIRGIGKTKGTTIIESRKGQIERPIVEREQGRISQALLEMNVYSKLRGAKMVTVTVTGKHRDKAQRIKIQIPISPKNKRLDDFVIARIVDGLRLQGYRTQYDLNVVKWSTTKVKKDKKGRVIAQSKAGASRMKVLSQTRIIVHIQK